jgi:hypothetical protein
LRAWAAGPARSTTSTRSPARARPSSPADRRAPTGCALRWSRSIASPTRER